MSCEPVALVGRVTVIPAAGPDRRCLLLLITLALAWQLFRPALAPAWAEAGHETVSVNLERVGGRFLATGIIPIQCGDIRR